MNNLRQSLVRIEYSMWVQQRLDTLHHSHSLLTFGITNELGFLETQAMFCRDATSKLSYNKILCAEGGISEYL